MKTFCGFSWLVSSCTACLLASTAITPAAEPNNVILHYRTVSLGYAYSPNFADADVDMHEANASLSYDISNVLLGVDVGNGWLTESDLNVFQVHPTIGYILKPTEQLHIIPQVGGQYVRLHDWDHYFADGWNLDTTLRLNYAITDRVQVGVVGGYIWNLDAEVLGWDAEGDDTWTAGADLRLAVTNDVGLVPFISYQHQWDVLRFGVSLTFGF